LYDVDAWATVDEIERRGRTRRTAIAAVGAGSVGAAVLGLVAFTGPPAGLGERPPTRQTPASVTADLAGLGASLGPASGVLRRHAK
jgi:drug/metabolite transporter (DMT)-like permease